MKNLKFRKFFIVSQNASVLKELVTYGFMLLCGYLVSDLLKKVTAGTIASLFQEIGITLAVLVSGAICVYGLSLWCSRKRKEDTQRMREYLYGKVMDGTLKIENRGEMNVRFQKNVDTVACFFYETCPKAVSGILIMVSSGLLLCFHSLPIGIIFLGLNFTQLIPVTVYERWAKDVYNQTNRDEEAYQNWILEGYNGIRTLKAYNGENWFLGKYRKLNRSMIASGKRAEQVGIIEDIIYAAIDTLVRYGSFLVVGLFVLMGKVSIGAAPLLLILAGYLYSSIQPVYHFYLNRSEYEEACKRLAEQGKEVPQDSTDVFIKADNVCKSFEGKELLRNVSCGIFPGDRIWLQGKNGSGKSTLLRIITGLEAADKGTVARGIPMSSTAVLLQENPVLTVTGRELCDAMIREGGVDQTKFNCHTKAFGIEELLDKPLSRMSPGERKKFYLSAVLAKDSKFMILDEPTNHVDQECIKYLLAEMRAYPGTLLVSTHQNGLDWGSNRSLEMEGGTLHEI